MKKSDPTKLRARIHELEVEDDRLAKVWSRAILDRNEKKENKTRRQILANQAEIEEAQRLLKEMEECSDEQTTCHG